MAAFKLYNDISSVPYILENEKSERILLVTGKGSYEKSGARDALHPYLKNIDHYRFSAFETNPKFEDLLKGAQLVENYNPDLIIAIGGGSVLDTAKIIALLPCNLTDAKKAITVGGQVLTRKSKFVAIPTTAGSGSECTHFAVAYINKIKHSVVNSQFIPDYVILDYRFTLSMSAYMTAVTGMDALSQAIESFWAVDATKESCTYAREAIEIMLDVFPKIVHNPTTIARKKMLLGAHLAGKAISISKTTAPHALSYSFTMNYNIPHGYAVFLTLPSFYMINANASKENLNQKLTFLAYKERIDELNSVFEKKHYNNVFNYLNNIILDSGLSLHLRDLGIKHNDLGNIIKNVNIERMTNNPVTINNDEVFSLLKSIW